MYNIDLEAENQIYDAINKIIDSYLEGKTLNTKHARNVFSKDDYDSYFKTSERTLRQAKKDYSKKSAINHLLKDIKYVAYHLFDQDEIKYKMVVKKILNDIIEDRIAEEKDKNNINKMKNLKTFENFKNDVLYIVYDKITFEIIDTFNFYGQEISKLLKNDDYDWVNTSTVKNPKYFDILYNIDNMNGTNFTKKINNK